MKNKNGFTLLEIIIVVVIAGVLATLALPRYNASVEKSRTTEAVQILDALKDAQLVYFYEHNAYATNVDDLEITIPTLRNFADPSVNNDASKVAEIARNNGGPAYSLSITSTGTISCTGACNNLGFN